jgi:hypothetical protein
MVTLLESPACWWLAWLWLTPTVAATVMLGLLSEPR